MKPDFDRIRGVFCRRRPPRRREAGREVDGTTVHIRSAQATVNRFAALRRELSVPPSFQEAGWGCVGMEGAFDVNVYFSALTHLSTEPGYVLDDLWLCGLVPLIYGRPSDRAPLRTLDEYSEYVGGCRWWDNNPGLDTIPVINPAASSPLEHVEIADTAEGYFQSVVFIVMGSQFYQVWHACYDDRRLVCSRRALASPLSAPRAVLGLARRSKPDGELRKAATVDLRPTVSFAADRVRVTVVTFTAWGGLQALHHTITRSFPHRVLRREAETLVEYECNLMI